MSYPLKGTIGCTPTHGVDQLTVLGTYGGFTLPLLNGKILLARRDDKPTIPYPGWFNCLGGGAAESESSLDQVIGREFTEESLCDLGEIVGRVGRPLRAILGRPKVAGDPVSIDTAEAWVVRFSGEPKLTDESREFRWFDFQALRDEQNIVGRDITPFGRTMMFALWGVSLARAPLYDGPVRDDVAERLKVRFIPSPNYSLVADDRYLFRVSVVNGDRHVQVWHNLALSSEADESGVVPNGPLADLF